MGKIRILNFFVQKSSNWSIFETVLFFGLKIVFWYKVYNVSPYFCWNIHFSSEHSVRAWFEYYANVCLMQFIVEYQAIPSLLWHYKIEYKAINGVDESHDGIIQAHINGWKMAARSLGIGLNNLVPDSVRLRG